MGTTATLRLLLIGAGLPAGTVVAVRTAAALEDCCGPAVDVREALPFVGLVTAAVGVAELSRNGVAPAASGGGAETATAAVTIGVARLASNCCSNRPLETQSRCSGPMSVATTAVIATLTRTYVESPVGRANTLNVDVNVACIHS